MKKRIRAKVSKEVKSTLDKLKEDPKWKESFDKGYIEFLISEIAYESLINTKPKGTGWKKDPT